MTRRPYFRIHVTQRVNDRLAEVALDSGVTMTRVIEYLLCQGLNLPEEDDTERLKDTLTAYKVVDSLVADPPANLRCQFKEWTGPVEGVGPVCGVEFAKHRELITNHVFHHPLFM